MFFEVRTIPVQIIVRCVFIGILAYLVVGLPRTSQDFPGLILIFVGIMPDKAILVIFGRATDFNHALKTLFCPFSLVLKVHGTNAQNIKKFRFFSVLLFYCFSIISTRCLGKISGSAWKCKLLFCLVYS